MAAPDLSGEDARTPLIADIGVEQRARGAPKRPVLDNSRQRSGNGFEAGDLLVGETSGILGRERCAVDYAICEDQRHGEIIRHALLPQFREHREIDRAILVGEPATDDRSGIYDAPYGALPEIFRLEGFKWCAVHLYSRACFP
jgi:hypothetical protein